MPQRHSVAEVDGERNPQMDKRSLSEARGYFPSAVDALALLRHRIYNGEDIDGVLDPIPDGASGSNLDSYSDDDDDEHDDDRPVGESQWTGGSARRRRPYPRSRSFANTLHRFTRGLVGSRYARSHLDEAH